MVPGWRVSESHHLLSRKVWDAVHLGALGDDDLGIVEEFHSGWRRPIVLVPKAWDDLVLH